MAGLTWWAAPPSPPHPPHVMNSMSRRGYVPHGGGVLQGMKAAAALCCLGNADIVSSYTWQATVCVPMCYFIYTKSL